jgi:hypothetical protein
VKRAHHIIVLERNGKEFVVLGMSFPPKGQKPIGYDAETYIEVEPDAYMVVAEDTPEARSPFRHPTKEDAERWAAKLPVSRVEFIP